MLMSDMLRSSMLRSSVGVGGRWLVRWLVWEGKILSNTSFITHLGVEVEDTRTGGC